MESDTSRIYSFIPISEQYSVLVKYDTDYMERLICADSALVDQDTTESFSHGNQTVGRGGCSTVKIRVLFLFTELAAEAIPNVQNVANRVINQLNASTIGSGLGRDVIIFEQAAVLPYDFTEGIGTIAQDVANLTLNPDAIELREDNYADVVVLLTDDVYDVAGKAKGIGVVGFNAYCIAVINAAANNFTASHEIGHLIGARHHKCSTCLTQDCDIFTSHHGFPVGDHNRTIMYTFVSDEEDIEECGARIRVNAWSSETATFMGNATGNSNNRNTRKLTLRADNVACFEDSPPPSAIPGLLPINISGPTHITDCGPTSSIWTALPTSGLTSPVFYTWEWSLNGIGGWTNLGTTSSITINHASLPTSWFVLRLRVTDGSPGYGARSMAVKYTNCFQGDDKIESRGISEKLQLNVFPNPSYEKFTIEYGMIGEIKDIDVIDVFGKRIEFTEVSRENSKLNISLDGQTIGIYFLNITDMKGNNQICKLLKL